MINFNLPSAGVSVAIGSNSRSAATANGGMMIAGLNNRQPLSGLGVSMPSAINIRLRTNSRTSGATEKVVAGAQSQKAKLSTGSLSVASVANGSNSKQLATSLGFAIGAAIGRVGTQYRQSTGALHSNVYATGTSYRSQSTTTGAMLFVFSGRNIKQQKVALGFGGQANIIVGG